MIVFLRKFLFKNKLKYLSLFLNFLILNSYCQKQTNNWLISDSSWINFNVPNLQVKNSHKSFVFSACASISDDFGNLLFYTNGIEVFNKNGQTMPNSTLFNDVNINDATQGALIIKNEYKLNQYYLFLVGFGGLRYTIVDMNMNGGKGDVIMKPQIIYKTNSPKLTVAKHCNNKDYWLITTEIIDYSDSIELNPSKYIGNERKKDVYILAFNLNEFGIVNSPIKSQTFVNTNICESVFPFSYGQIKMSPNGKLAAFAHKEDLYIYDFNNSTGQFILSKKLQYPIDYNIPDFCDYVELCIEFFSDSKKLMFNNLFIDLANNTSQLIGNFLYTQLQLASDGKIYFNYNTKQQNQIGVSTKNYLSFFEFKNNTCQVFYDTIWLKKDYTTFGLPNFPSFYFDKRKFDFNYKGSCVNTSFTFTPNLYNNPYTNIEWRFIDDNSLVNNLNANHTYTASGEYEVELIVSFGSISDTIRQCVNVLGNSSNFFAKLDTFYCFNKSIKIGATYPNLGRYKWNTGDSTSSIEVNKAGIYILQISNNCSVIYDTLNVMEEMCQPEILVIPNIFTPNNDNVNDVFSVKSTFYKHLDFHIFNRWGEEIANNQINILEFISNSNNILKLENQNVFNLWDGKLKNGNLAENGTYFIVINALSFKNNVKKHKSWLQLQK